MILHLTLQKKWFDLIRGGKKTEEYREIKPYWAIRLCQKIHVPRHWGGYLTKAYHLCDPEKREEAFNDTSIPTWADITHIKFTNGYSDTSPTFTIECKGIRIGRGNPEWGAPVDKDVFIISLGKIVEL